MLINIVGDSRKIGCWCAPARAKKTSRDSRFLSAARFRNDKRESVSDLLQLLHSLGLHRQRMADLQRSASYGVVVESGPGHFFHGVQVAAVQNDGAAEQFAHLLHTHPATSLPS